jgi:hypothetical protein
MSGGTAESDGSTPISEHRIALPARITGALTLSLAFGVREGKQAVNLRYVGIVDTRTVERSLWLEDDDIDRLLDFLGPVLSKDKDNGTHRRLTNG